MSPNSETTLTPCQDNALDLLNGEENIFLTGVAGSGKSFLLNYYLENKDRKSFPIVASTGAAAVLVNGVTFHSFFALGILEGGLDRTVDRAIRDKRLLKRLKRVKEVIIDEISMIPGLALEAAETICRLVLNNDLPWGGIRIIAVGDFGQLPPVSHFGSKKDWAFQSETWEKSNFRVAYLTTVMRAKDSEFLRVLNLIRDGHVDESVTQFLNSRMIPTEGAFQGTRLSPHRSSVEEYNLKKLADLPGELFVFNTNYSSTKNYLEQIKKTAPLPEILQLKIGALIMIRKNDPAQHIVNGSLGYLKTIESDKLEVELLSGRCVAIERETFSSLNAEGEEVAWATNFPVNLAWATTIHKAQGLTLDLVQMDLSKVFEAGQAYVALSRVRSAEGLFLTGWSAKTIRSSSEVSAFHAKITMQN